MFSKKMRPNCKTLSRCSVAFIHVDFSTGLFTSAIMRPPLVLLLVLLLISCVYAQQKCLNVGRTVSKIGTGQLGSAESQEAVDFFFHWVNNVRGGVRWNGTAYEYCCMLNHVLTLFSFNFFFSSFSVNLFTLNDASGLGFFYIKEGGVWFSLFCPHLMVFFFCF